MRTSKRIALPLAVALHLLAFYLCDRYWQIRWERRSPPGTALAVRFISLPPREDIKSAAAPELQRDIVRSAAPPRRSEPIAISIAPASRQVSIPKMTAPPPNAESKPLVFDPAALVKSVRYEDTKSDLQKAIEAHGGTMEVVKQSKYEQFHDTAEAATIPDCLAADGLKLDPPHIGPIGLGGIFALPFVAHAAITGKCR